MKVGDALSLSKTPRGAERTPDADQVRRELLAQGTALLMSLISPQEQPHTPTPGAEACAPISSPQPVVHWLSAVLAMAEAQMQGALHKLCCLHPACCLIPPESATLALGILRQYIAQAGLGHPFATLQPFNVQAVVATCLWAAIKFLATPGVVPSAPFMTSATGVSAGLLLELEPQVLGAVDWNILAIARCAAEPCSLAGH